MIRQLIVLLIICAPIFSVSQNIDYTKHIIDTLTSPYFAGRGAVDSGEIKAAQFLKKEFLRIGLKPFDDNYFQTFKYPINSFPRKASLTIDGEKLIPGLDFLIEPNSGSIGGSYQLVWYYKGNIPSKKELKKLVDRRFFADKFIVIDEERVDKNDELFELLKLNIYGAAGIIFLEPTKLTQGLSQTYVDYGVLRVKKDKISRKCRSIQLEIDQKFIPNQKSQNVIGYIKGEQYPDSFVVVSAHYDHLGMMGSQVYFPGANDNASGVAMLLNLAYHYTHKELPKKTIVFMLFGAEEVGILGSKYFVENPTFLLDKINFVMNLDLLGTGDDGAMVVNATVFPEHFKRLDSINTLYNYMPNLKKRGKAANSDHYWFTEKGIPSFFMYTLGGISAYHDIDDVYKTLPLTKFENCFRLIRDFIDEL